jgi:hypothetical protein
MQKSLMAAVMIFSLACGAGASARWPAQDPAGASPSGFRLLDKLVSILLVAGSPGASVSPLDEIIGLSGQLKTERAAGRVDDVFAARFSRLLSVVRFSVDPKPQPQDWPMTRFLMMDFIEQATGRMPDGKDIQDNVSHHGGPGIGLAMLADAVLSEVVNLHIYLETLPRRQEIVRRYMDKRAGEPEALPRAR